MPVEKPVACLKCGTPLPERVGTGRPSLYCGATCRRLAEFEIRRVDRRLAGYGVELREELADRASAADACVDKLTRTRIQRINDLKKWIAADEQRLRELAGGHLCEGTEA